MVVCCTDVFVVWCVLQVMVAKVSSLLKTVKNVEDEASKGVQSLENTIEAIDAGIRAYNSGELNVPKASPQELIRATKVSGSGNGCG